MSLDRATIEDRILQFYRRPNARAVFGTFADRTVDLVAVAQSIGAAFDVGTGGGEQLDRLGEILQLPREGADDARYRVLLRMQIQTILSSAGTSATLLEIVRAFTDADAIAYREPPNGPSSLIMLPVMRTLIDTVTGVVGTDDGSEYSIASRSRILSPSSDDITWPSPHPVTGAPMTISLRVLSADWATVERRPILLTTSGGAMCFFLGSLAGGYCRVWHQHGTTSPARTSAAGVLVNGTRQRITITYDGSSLASGVRIYVGRDEVGSYVTTTNGAGTATSADGGEISLGYQLVPGVSLDGEVSDLAVWDRVLSPAEVADWDSGLLAPDWEGWAEAEITAAVDMTDDSQLVAFLRKAKPGGVRLTLAEEPTADALTMDYTDADPISGSAGLLDYTDADPISGTAGLIGYEVVI